jgi:hypothetical protein
LYSRETWGWRRDFGNEIDESRQADVSNLTDPGETEKYIPKGLKDGLKKANCLQDILKHEMGKSVGKNGNDILKSTLDIMRKEGLEGSIYSHPIGDWGHWAGTLIGTSPCPLPP